MADERPVRVRPWVRTLVRVVLPVVLLVAAWQIWDNVEARRLEPLVAQMREVAKSGPRQPVIDPPDTANAARHYAAGAMFVEQNPRGGFDAKYRHITRAWSEALAGGPAPPDWMRGAMVKALAHNRVTLEQIEAGAEAEFYGFAWIRRDVERTFGLRDAARVEAMRTIERLAAADTAGAAASLYARIRYLRAYQNNAGLAAYQKTTDLRSIVEDLGLLLPQPDVRDTDLDRIERALGACYIDERSDRLMAEAVLSPHDWIEEMGNGRSWQYGTAGIVLRPALRNGLVATMRTAADALAVADKPWPERLRAVDGLTPHEPFISWTPTSMTSMSAQNIYIDLLKSRVTLHASGMMLARAARLAVAIDRRRRMHGVLPGRLSDVAGGDDTLDFYSGQPLQYRQEAGSFTVYSVGPGYADDKGAVVPVPKKGIAPGTSWQFDPPLDVGVRVVYRRAAASTSPSNSGLNSPVR